MKWYNSVLHSIFGICMIASITYLTAYFNNPALMWWYVAAIITYTFVESLK